jgi:hypothetical protein
MAGDRMKTLDKFLEDVDDLANRVYDLPVPVQAKDKVADLLEQVTYLLEEQAVLRSTEWGE